MSGNKRPINKFASNFTSEMKRKSLHCLYLFYDCIIYMELAYKYVCLNTEFCTIYVKHNKTFIEPNFSCNWDVKWKYDTLRHFELNRPVSFMKAIQG